MTGVDVPKNSAIVHEMRTLRERIVEAQRTHTVAPILTHLYAAIEASTPPRSGHEIACKAGCGWCCHTRVPATAPELLYLAAGGLSMQAIKPAILEGAAQRQADEARRAGFVPRECPVLLAALCAEHPRRPVVCRTAVSFDAEGCRQALADPHRAVIPTEPRSIALRAAFDIALHGALLHAGYAPRRYELVTGLADILVHPEPEAAWLSGEPLFENALVIEEEDFLAVPLKKACYDAAFG